MSTAPPLRIILITGLILFVGSIGLLSWLGTGQETDNRPGERSLLLYCAAGIKEPVEAIIQQYERETGRRVQIEYGGSGTLLAKLEVIQQGDIYIAGDDSFVQKARQKKLVREIIPVAEMKPIILVAEGNPKDIRGLMDLLREDVKVALGNPEAAAVGKMAKQVLSDLGKWEAMETAILDRGVTKPTVNELALDVSLGSVDAAIVFDPMVSIFEGVEAITDPHLDVKSQQVTLGVLEAADKPAAALHLARYLAGANRGLLQFREKGFTPVAGDEWVEIPILEFYSGSVNRVSIDKKIREFEIREGVVVNRVYNGCGILVSQMRAGANPDAYFACDTTYMDDVYERFRDHQMVTETDMVLITAKGNPKGITTLQDLARKDVKVATSNPEYSALGGLTHELFRQAGLYNEILPRITFGDAPTADTVVLRVRTGREDAGIVYRANVLGMPDEIEVLDIHHPRAVAGQPVAVAVGTAYPRLTERLIATLVAPGMKELYEAAGFRYKVGMEMPAR